MTAVPALICRNVSRRYGGRQAVDDASFVMPPGRVTCLLGPSGSGKSTLLRLIAGLEPVDGGDIAIAGRVMSAPRQTMAPDQRGVGLVFQDHALFPHLSVRANIGFGLTGLARAARAARVDTLMTRFHIAHLGAAWPHMLSGGEQQRVAIARALAREPALLLLDEPFSGLDGRLRADVRAALLADLAALGASVLIVTHDPEEAMAIADHIVLMADGRILQAGTAEHCFRSPASVAAARLLGAVSVLPCTVRGGVAQTPLGPLDAAALPDGPADLVLRDHMLVTASDGVAAQVEHVQFCGQGHVVAARIAGERVTVQCDTAPPTPGDTIMVALHRPVTGIFPRGA